MSQIIRIIVETKKGGHMSAVYFHSKESDAVRVSGAERAYANILTANLMASIFESSIGSDLFKRKLIETLPKDCRVQETDRLLSWLKSSTFGSTKLTVGDEALDVFSLSLNTAIVCGSDAIRLLARIHGQCEIHCYVEGGNRKWLSAIIKNGLETKVLRGGMGWDNVVSTLLLSDETPVVCGYSVTESFPNRYVAKYSDNRDGEDWYEMSLEAQWEMAINELRKERGLEIAPTGWDDFRFTHCKSAFDVINSLSRR